MNAQMHPECTLHRVSEHVWWFTPEARRDRPSLAVVTDGRDSLLLDVGASPAHLAELMAALASNGVPKPSRAVLTHAHWDHVFGLDAFGGEVIAHRRTAAQLARMRTWDYSDAGLPGLVADGREIAFTAEYIPRELTDAQRRDLKLREPDVVFDERIDLEVGALNVEAHHVGGDHAADSVVIYVPDDRMLFIGDCLCDDLWAPVRRYTRSRFLPLLAKLEAMEAGTMIEGHNNELLPRAQFVALAAVVRDTYATFDRLGPASLERVRADLITRHAAELVDDLLPPLAAGLDQS
ncbi:MAG: MBL fold metallo-hydrolase [Opitutaceae bacterium]